MRKNKNLVLVVASLFLATLWGCGSNMDSGGDQTGPGTEIADAAKLGSSSCKVCHTTVAVTENFNGSAHDNDAVAGCEGCHGGGQYHKGVGPIPVPAPKVEVCTTCHTGDHVAHGGTLTECLGCHDPHSLATPFASITPDAQGFVGADTCKQCHASTHNEWKDSWHTLKARQGPNQLAGSTENITGWALTNWSSLKTHLILDQYRTTTGAAGTANVPAGFSLPTGYIGMWVTAKKFDVSEVDVVIGQTRKQRYGVYYDGGPVNEVYLVYSTNGGIKYELYPDAANPQVFTFAGEKNRAGYKLLWVEVQLDRAAQANANNYEEWRSWQERCVDCHTTGFNRTAYNQAMADFKAGTRTDMKQFFFTEWQVSCEACHSPGANHSVINPAKLPKTPGAYLSDRNMACNQCHTRTNTNKVDTTVANDKRGYIFGSNVEITEGTKTYNTGNVNDWYTWTRPAWGTGNRQVSIDGKGRRDHQQDMDIMLTRYIHEVVKGGGPGSSYHGNQDCFDCHATHKVGGNSDYKTTVSGGLVSLKTANDPTGEYRLKADRNTMCGTCHDGTGASLPSSINVTTALARLNGTTGWPSYGWTFVAYPGTPATSNFGGEGGRSDRKTHLFNTEIFDVSGTPTAKVYGLPPSEYIWSIDTSKVNVSTTSADYVAIWPWEISLQAAGKSVVYGSKSDLTTCKPNVTRPGCN